jgi:hypothetical protein
LRLAGFGWFAQDVAFFCSWEVSIRVDLHAKNTKFAPFRKVMSFVFSKFLASFPLFLYFLGRLWISTQSGNLQLGRIPAPSTQAGTHLASKSSNSVFNARIEHSI